MDPRKKFLVKFSFALILVAVLYGLLIIPALPKSFDYSADQICIEVASTALARADRRHFKVDRLVGENRAAYARENGRPVNTLTDAYEVFSIADATGETVQLWIIENNCVVAFSDVIPMSVFFNMLFRNGGSPTP